MQVEHLRLLAEQLLGGELSVDEFTDRLARGPIADLGVAQIAKVISLGSFSQPRLFRLHKVADVRALADLAARTHMRIRAHDGACRNEALVDDAAVPDMHIIPNL